MSTERIVVGLDVGTTKVCAVVGQLNADGRVNILGVGKAESEGVRRGVIDNIDKTVNAIRQAVQQAEQHANVEINLVTVGIAGEHIRSMQHNGIITLNNPDVEITLADVQRLREDMYKIAVPPGTDILHVIPQDYTVDTVSGVEDPVGMSGVRLEGNFHIVTGQSSAANSIYKCVRKAGLEVEDLILQPIASSHAVLSEEELEAGVCLVDIGGGTTDVAIFENNVIRHTAVIPFGGQIITEDIKHGCSVMRKQAEFLKHRFGSALADEVVHDEVITISGLRDRPPKEIRKRTLASIIQARMEEIIELVALEIKRAGYENRLVGGIVVTGGGAMLEHVEHLFAYVTGIDSRKGSPIEHLDHGMVSEVDHPSFATGTGLVTYTLMSEAQAAARKLRERAKRSSGTAQRVPAGAGFIGKLKNWFETSLTNTGADIE